MNDLEGVPAEAMDRVTAVVDLIGRTGAESVQIRYCDEEKPTVWMVVAEYKRRKDRNSPTMKHHEVAAAMTPDVAGLRLAERLVDGGQCTHCKRPTALSDDWQGEAPLDELICWYLYDPELKTFRRGCE